MSVRKECESFESVDGAWGLSGSIGCDSVLAPMPRGARCGRPRTAVATTATGCAIRAISPMRNGQQIEPLIPPAKRGGGKRTVDMREVVNGVMYVLSTGCQWRYIPKDLPPRSTVNGYSAGGAGTARWRGCITRSM